jgi:Zn-dependent protease with chaperone function
METPALFSAIIGFWHPEFVVSTGLLKTLDQVHIEAVIAHEKAHYYYRDTFGFFWAGIAAGNHSLATEYPGFVGRVINTAGIAG